jgi:hypothetical protein
MSPSLLGRRTFTATLLILFLSLFLSDARPQAVQPWVNVRDFGAVGDGVTDDTNALLAAIKAAGQSFPRSAVFIPAGTFRYTKMIKIDGLMVYGEGSERSVLLAANNRSSSWILTGQAPKICDLRIRTAVVATTRDTRADATGIDVCDATNFTIQRVHVGPVASAGILVRRSSGTTTSASLIKDCTIEQVLADGIHVTEGSHYINIIQNEVFKTGDDFIAVVSYRWNTSVTRDITISKNTVSVQNHGRGISVVGGERVVIDSNIIERSAGAGVYLASEANYNTFGVSDIKVTDNTLINVAKGDVGHGGIHLSGRAPVTGSSYNSVKNVTISGNRITDVGSNGLMIGSYTDTIAFSGNEITGAPKNGIFVSPNTKDVSISALGADRNIVRNCGEYGIYVKPAGGAGTLKIASVLFQNLNTRRLGYVDAVNIEPNGTFSKIELVDNRLEQPPSGIIERLIECSSVATTVTGNSANRTITSRIPLQLGIGPLP